MMRCGVALFRAAVFLITLTASAGAADGSSECRSVSALDRGGKHFFELGEVWTGVGTRVGSAASSDGRLLLAYYDPDRWVTISAFDPGDGRLCSFRLPSQFDGWDAHNRLEIAVSSDGLAHVVGNMHASKMFYARGPLDDIGAMRPESMIGKDENRATYPVFLKDASGRLLFMYRSGGSGDGSWLMNQWGNGRWTRIGELFASRDARDHASAYPTPFVQGRDGEMHIAAIWRRNPDVSSNFAITYASTRDFRNWRGEGGKTVSAPLRPETMAMVDSPGEGAGLLQSTLLLRPDGEPAIMYMRYGSQGADAVFLATRDSARNWRSREIVGAAERSSIAGRGAIPNLPHFVILDQQGAKVRFRVALAGEDRRRFVLDLTSGAIEPDSAPPPPSRDIAMPKALKDGLADVVAYHGKVLKNGAESESVVGALQWFAQRANHDRPRECSSNAPLACRPPASPLYYIPDAR
ncbi:MULTISPECIES: BNR-4 repeat-containing protein [Methylosinus]|nr:MULTISPECIES: BNR-4 repeat-containing protein [Methylosinus]OBS53660.1 hypothetical protein A8B73_04885 [Methylosinus sp. 3S-1]